VKVGDPASATPPRRREVAASRSFGDTLRRARRTGRNGAAQVAPGPEAASAPARAAPARRAAADRADDALRGRREVFREETRSAEPLTTPPAAPAPAPEGQAPATPELRALVRTLPLAVQTFGVREGAPLALSFGRSLDVELRAAPRGLELVLRPEPRLARASEAELRGVVAALARKGIAVSRAEVRVRGQHAAGEHSPRVDVAAGLR
jgi:hypothetical protein